jgi:glutathione S-transferase
LTPVLTIIGNHISPFVRKVLAVCEAKQLPYELDSIVPFFGNDRFTELSPLRRIPVLIDGETVLTDSSVICEYLEDKWPSPSVLPGGASARAHARFLDEFADTRLADVVLWKVFGRALIGPAIFGLVRDTVAIESTVRDEVPLVLNLLEKWAPNDDFVGGGHPSLADISVAVQFANFRWARQDIDAKRWPRTSRWIQRVSAVPEVKRLNDIGARLLRVPPDAHRAVLLELGVRVTAQSLGTNTPRRGPMTVL